VQRSAAAVQHLEPQPPADGDHVARRGSAPHSVAIGSADRDVLVGPIAAGAARLTVELAHRSTRRTSSTSAAPAHVGKATVELQHERRITPRLFSDADHRQMTLI
jgi:hypothetical protein